MFRRTKSLRDHSLCVHSNRDLIMRVSERIVATQGANCVLAKVGVHGKTGWP